MKMISIYALLCPKTGDVRYVGKSIHPVKRLGQHRRAAKTKASPLHQWLNKLAASGLQPVLRILSIETEKSWQNAERTAISFWRKVKPLLNVQKGGEGVPMAYRNDPRRKRLAELKQQLGCSMRSMKKTNPRGYAKLHAKCVKAAKKHPAIFESLTRI